MKRVLISAGEASGDNYGAQLVEALRRREPGLEVFGMGGERMRAAGCDTVVAAKDVAVVGLVEVVAHLPRIYAKFRELLREVDRRRPDAAVLIDFPDFNLRLARQLHRRGIPVFYYVSPQLWAWRQGRIRLVKKYVRKMLVIFPFEVDFYRNYKVEVEHVGHPLAGLKPPVASREAFAKQNGLDASRQWIALLPGSRRREVTLNLPAMLQAVPKLGNEYQFLLPVAATLERDWMQHQLGGQKTSLVSDALSALHHSRGAVVASGTATVEAALMGTPFVAVYRVSRLTWTLGRGLVNVPFFAMVNLIEGEMVVPELIQDAFTPENIERKLRPLLADGSQREQMLARLAGVRARLEGAGRKPAAERVADVVLAQVSQPVG